jgi:hypothetical protein
MWHRQVFLLLFSAGLVPGAARGQIAEVDEGESIKISAGRPASDEILPDLVVAAKTIVTRTNNFRGSKGHRPAERAKEHDYCIVSENIANQFSSAGFTTKEMAKDFFQGWKHSPGHRKDMLDADVTQTGVAVARSEQSGYYYAMQMFGRPKSMSIEFQIANNSDAIIPYSIGSRTFPLHPLMPLKPESIKAPGPNILPVRSRRKTPLA